MVEVATAAGVPVETLRKIEAGRVPTPAFFTIVALAGVLELPVERLARQCTAATAATTSLIA
jgi:transcriptional regulator with XRE-family HTH domain